ncbi:cation:proton antiporter [Arthrobacter sp. BF1]|uniref:cation:proton antiporter domain-containing protein n=1 Tax=Arthrobacter sp. BF1 TaxID=2821145 RepID=UPI002119DF47|nr:cation:proton antiporter [Arthrobacter sp. BF1]
MTFPLLAVICAAALLGPLLAVPRRWRVPIVVGELLAGILIGRSGLALVDPAEPAFAFLADVGFALVMFVAGSHVPLTDASLRSSLSKAAFRLAAIAGIGVAVLFDRGQAPLYAVLMASSPAAMVLPMVTSLGLRGPGVLATMAQVAMADILAIVALPLAMDPSAAGRTALGAAAVLAGAAVVYFVLREGELRGAQQRLHRVSEKRKFALELRLQLVVLFALAGFSFGLAVAAVGGAPPAGPAAVRHYRGLLGAPVLCLARCLLAAAGPG